MLPCLLIDNFIFIYYYFASIIEYISYLLLVDCANTRKIANGRVKFDGHRSRLFGTYAYFSCNKGYKLHPPGRTQIKCNFGGFWETDYPVCIEGKI